MAWAVTSQRGLMLNVGYIPSDCLVWIAGAHLVEKMWNSASYIEKISIPVLYRAAYVILGLYVYKVYDQAWLV